MADLPKGSGGSLERTLATFLSMSCTFKPGLSSDEILSTFKSADSLLHSETKSKERETLDKY